MLFDLRSEKVNYEQSSNTPLDSMCVPLPMVELQLIGYMEHIQGRVQAQWPLRRQQQLRLQLEFVVRSPLAGVTGQCIHVTHQCLYNWASTRLAGLSSRKAADQTALLCDSCHSAPMIVNKLIWFTDHIPTDHIPTKYKPHTNHTPITYQPHTNHTPTKYRPHTVPTKYQPHTNHFFLLEG